MIFSFLNAISIQFDNKELQNTKSHGCPQSRERLYVVSFRNDWFQNHGTGKFEFPEPIDCPPFDRFLVGPTPKQEQEQSEKPFSNTVRASIRRAKAMLKQQGKSDRGIVIDAQASSSYASMRENESPCLTKARGSTGHFLLEHNRFMTIYEIGGLQGFSKEHVNIFMGAVPAATLGKGFGDAMSLNVLVRILAKALPSSGLTKPLGKVYDQPRASGNQKAEKRSIWS